MNGSSEMKLSRSDIGHWLKNALIFAAPALLIFLLQIQQGSTVMEAMIAIKVWGLSTGVDLLRKFVTDTSK